MAKCLGIIIVIASSTGLGIHFYKEQKDRLKICNELILICDSLAVNLSYSPAPIKDLLSKLISEHNSLSFVDLSCLTSKSIISSSLSQNENEEISKFLYSLGKSNVTTQLKLIKGFREYVKSLVKKYENDLNQKGRLCICFGSFIGIMISVILL